MTMTEQAPVAPAEEPCEPSDLCCDLGDLEGPDPSVCLPGGEKKRILVVKTGKGEKPLVLGGGLDLGDLKEVLKDRGNIVMTRVKDEDLKTIDLLVEAGLFDSRSEAAAFLLHEGIGARKDLVERVRSTAEQIQQLKRKMREQVGG